ncbi:hypothetical protein CMUS01_02312 [Colletotrichum musicola]|uniref:Uncharacterized protein n=1 Tax=Colletotrichum musicola TaxID=2175873 RepID=A0A8H6U7P2_9PEZI|nr:hypothetical protein CMUS01_02312 [Colletotrichum musicola]
MAEIMEQSRREPSTPLSTTSGGPWLSGSERPKFETENPARARSGGKDEQKARTPDPGRRGKGVMLLRCLHTAKTSLRPHPRPPSAIKPKMMLRWVAGRTLPNPTLGTLAPRHYHIGFEAAEYFSARRIGQGGSISLNLALPRDPNDWHWGCQRDANGSDVSVSRDLPPQGFLTGWVWMPASGVTHVPREQLRVRAKPKKKQRGMRAGVPRQDKKLVWGNRSAKTDHKSSFDEKPSRSPQAYRTPDSLEQLRIMSQLASIALRGIGIGFGNEWRVFTAEPAAQLHRAQHRHWIGMGTGNSRMQWSSTLVHLLTEGTQGTGHRAQGVGPAFLFHTTADAESESRTHPPVGRSNPDDLHNLHNFPSSQPPGCHHSGPRTHRNAPSMVFSLQGMQITAKSARRPRPPTVVRRVQAASQDPEPVMTWMMANPAPEPEPAPAPADRDPKGQEKPRQAPIKHLPPQQHHVICSFVLASNPNVRGPRQSTQIIMYLGGFLALPFQSPLAAACPMGHGPMLPWGLHGRRCQYGVCEEAGAPQFGIASCRRFAQKRPAAS